MDKIIGIYKIECKTSRKVYIGQSCDIGLRLKNHRVSLKNNKHKNSYLQNSYNKYGQDCFTYEILEECTKKLLDKKEIYWINFYDSTNRNKGYNRESGGNKNKSLSTETKNKISKIKKSKVTDEFKETMKNVHRGLKSKKATSRYIGVSFDKETDKWRACITINRKNKYLGRYQSEAVAAIAYNNAAIYYFGQEAKINIIEQDGGFLEYKEIEKARSKRKKEKSINK